MTYMDQSLQDLAEDVRHLALSAVRTLVERGPHGLVEDGLCPPEWEQSLTENRNDYPDTLIMPPESAEVYFYVRDGVWEIDLPLHGRDGRMDLLIFLEIDPTTRSVRLRGLYTP
jgi:hypothetical protein